MKKAKSNSSKGASSRTRERALEKQLAAAKRSIEQARKQARKQARLHKSDAAKLGKVTDELGRTKEALNESLERQTATAGILRVIADSPTDIRPVFDVIVERAVQLCGARFGRVYQYDGTTIEMVAGHGLSAKGLGRVRQVFPRPASEDTIVGRVILAKRPYFVRDIERDKTVPRLSRQMIAALNTRSQVTVPMLRAGKPIGAITLGWDAPDAFDDHKVELLRTFAAQAVIAIENVRLFNETKEALERQTAIGEILRVISNSPGDVRPVLQAVAERAARICEAQFVDIVLAEGNTMRVGSSVGDTGRPTGEAIPLDRNTVMGRSIVDRKPVHIADLQSAGKEFPLGRQLAMRFGHRTILAVPLLREDRALGTILVRRNEVRPIEDKHVLLLQTFADQAALAIENARLFTETKDALERQTATGEILRVIASSPSDVQPVFDAIVRSAGRLFNRRASLRLVEHGGIRRRARSESAASDSPDVLPIDHDSLAGRVILDAVAQQVTDTLGPDAPPYAKANAHRWDFRANAAAPLIRDGTVIGLISVASPNPGALSDKQMALLATFADQAVIAIENLRLFNETKEALERQTATAEILKVIASSPSDVQPVLETLASSAARLCEANDVVIVLKEGDNLRYVVHHGDIPTGAPLGEVKRISPDWTTGRAALESRQIYIRDVLDETEALGEGARMGIHAGYRTVLATPLLREGAVLGVITMRRHEVQPFEPRQIELVNTFSDQAVIAIENVRLFNETKEALERQTATAEVLKVISGSLTDTQPVFDIIAERAARLTGATFGWVFRFDGEWINAASSFGLNAQAVEAALKLFPMRPSGGSYTARAIRDAVIINVADALAETDPEYVTKPIAAAAGYRSVLAVPMFRDQKVVGAIVVNRAEAGLFADKQVELLKTFADQAVIAIENVRLFNETQEALARREAAAQVLRSISESVSDTAPVFTAILDCCNRLIPSIDYVQVQLIESADRVRLVDHRFGQVRGAAPGKQDERRAELMAREAVHFPRPLAGSTLERALNQGRVVILADTLDGPDTPPGTLVEARRWGHSYSQITVPLMREGRCIGAIEAFRRQLGGFEPKESSLLESFADQAVIAIENVRLFNETKESLERQTATAEILKVIASSPSDVQPVFDAIAASARRLLGGHAANVARRAGDVLELAAFTSTGEAGDSEISRLWPAKITGKGHMGKALLSAAPAWVEDIETDLSYSEEFRAGARARGMRSAVSVPMLREGEAIGVISVNRSIPGRFSDHQTNLLQTFADQAVIAIENVRLFNETKEALERQTATGEILKAIASSPSDVQPVFDQILHSCQRLFEGLQIGLTLAGEDGMIHLGAYQGPNREHLERVYPYPLGRDSGSGQAMLDRTVVQFADIGAPGSDAPPRVLQGAQAAGVKSLIFAPLFAEGRPIGALWVGRRLPGAFDDDQAALLKTFADQAVIAIENVRLFNETKEALERQTATAEILQVISSSPTVVQPVFDAIVESAERLFGRSARIRLLEGNELHLRASSGPAGGAMPGAPLPATRDNIAGRAILDKVPMQVADTQATGAPPGNVGRGYRAIAVAPLLREDSVLGAIGVTSLEPGALSDKQMALLRTFADQAVIALENVRLFKELQSRTEDLMKSVGQLTALGEVGQAISSTLDLETVLKTIVQRAVQLTGLDSGAIYEYDESNEQFTLQAAEKIEPELVEAVRRTPIRKGDGATGRIAVSLEAEQVPDIDASSYQGSRKDVLMRSGYRAVLAVPLLREDHLLGALQVFRRASGAFAPEVVELLKTFATQSAMAIQNARLFREIAEKGKQLEEASKHKSQFLASMSHELRTPLNAILGFNEMILGDVYGEVPADMKEPLTDIQTSGKHLLRLINNVLDLAKIEAGRMELALADYSVQDTVESVRSTLRPLAAEKGLEFVVTVPADIPLAYGDSGRITQCLMNLAGNSLKFTKAGKVEISVEQDNGRLTYRVADTGIGIPPEKIASLFTEFKQTDATIASEYGGTGLGLSISKKFIEMHGGRIWVESEVGSGSRFIFEVPLRAGEGKTP
jgi:GAF domain-containing protein